jgi:hypothetical protein
MSQFPGDGMPFPGGWMQTCPSEEWNTIVKV